MGVPVVMGASGQSSSTTLSGVSGGKIVIRDETGQKALTGQTAAEAIAGLNRDTKDTLNSLDPIFKEKEIRAGFEIVGEAGRQVGQFLTNRAKEKQAAEKALSDAITTGRATDAASMSALLDEVQRTQDWTAGGKYGLILLALSGAAGANVTGSTSAFVQSAAVNYLQGLGAAQVKQIADSLGRDPQSEAARAALHGIVGCAGAAGQGAACASGALGASAGSILNSLMGSPEDLTPDQVEARRNLVTSLVAGIASVAGADAATAGTAAALETSQNWAQLAIPAVGAAATKCATTPSCQRAVTYVSDKTVYVAVQMKDGAIYVGTAALVGITAASDAVGNWVSEFVGSAVGRETALPGKPGEVVRVDTPPPLPSEKETFGSEIPVWPGDAVGPIAVPGQENNGPSGGTTTTTPLPEEQGPGLIFNNVDDILKPGGQFVGTVHKGATPDIRTVSSSDFDALRIDLLDGATVSGTYAGGKGTWYDLPGGGRVGLRMSDNSGATLDIDIPGYPKGFKVHQQ
jgi:filamentous hemagglutinin